MFKPINTPNILDVNCDGWEFSSILQPEDLVIATANRRLDLWLADDSVTTLTASYFEYSGDHPAEILLQLWLADALEVVPSVAAFGFVFPRHFCLTADAVAALPPHGFIRTNVGGNA
jgi:hypothetical protein